MNYEQIYNQLIEKRHTDKPDGYTERHHIIPRSLGGSDNSSNLVDLTAREHFIAHLLLAKFNPCFQTINSILIMRCGNKERHNIQNSRMYEWARKEFSKYMKTKRGVKNSQYGTMWISNIELKENKKISKDDVIPEGWVKGRSKWSQLKKCKCCSQEFMPRAHEAYCSSRCKDEFRINNPKIVSDQTKRILSLSAKKRAKEQPNTVMKGTIWVNNGIVNKRISKTESIPAGYSLGRKFKH